MPCGPLLIRALWSDAQHLTFCDCPIRRHRACVVQSYMGPGLSSFYGGNIGRSDVELSCQLRTQPVFPIEQATLDLAYIRLSQDSHPTFTAAARVMSAALYHVAVIVPLRAEFQMLGVYARRVVALVPDNQTRRDGPVCFLIRSPMRQRHAPFVANALVPAVQRVPALVWYARGQMQSTRSWCWTRCGVPGQVPAKSASSAPTSKSWATKRLHRA